MLNEHNLRRAAFVGVLLAGWVAYELPFALDCTIGAGLLAGWGLAKLLESLS